MNGVIVLKVAKLVSIATISVATLGTSLSTANAFQISEPSALGAGARQGATAYAEDDHITQAQAASMLTASEVRHIKWCAARYRLAYDPVNDIYAKGGESFQCISPR